MHTLYAYVHVGLKHIFFSPIFQNSEIFPPTQDQVSANAYLLSSIIFYTNILS